jgi:transcriptional regulator with XRE-family HTH domain
MELRRRGMTPGVISGRTEDEQWGDVPRQVTNEVVWYMRQHRITRVQLAKTMGITPGRVSQILSGDENLTLRTLGAVVTALGARIDVQVSPIDEKIRPTGSRPDEFRWSAQSS